MSGLNNILFIIVVCRWNQFRTAGNAERRTFPILDIPLDLPNDEEVARWLGEPVKAVCISEGRFYIKTINLAITNYCSSRLSVNELILV